MESPESAYAESRVMPNVVSGWPGQGGERLSGVGTILRGRRGSACLEWSVFLQTGR